MMATQRVQKDREGDTRDHRAEPECLGGKRSLSCILLMTTVYDALRKHKPWGPSMCCTYKGNSVCTDHEKQLEPTLNPSIALVSPLHSLLRPLHKGSYVRKGGSMLSCIWKH